MARVSVAVAALMSLPLSACSLLGLDDLQLAQCRADSDCQVFAAELTDPQCESLVCDLGTGRCETVAVDRDGDGEQARMCMGGTDCDDDAAGINAGATEICDGVDTDCDGSLNGPGEDDDGDGFADDFCAGSGAADCDDESPLTHRGAVELCDGVDNDCVLDGFIRIGGGPRVEPSEDADEDGHAPVDGTCSTEAPAGVTLLPKDDCDDSRADVRPGATEACDDVDNDCDGVVDNAPGSTRQGSACQPVALAAGGDHTCAMNRDGTVDCWGGNNRGQLGDGSLPLDTDRAVRVPGVEDAVQVVTGFGFGCALGRSGFITCWGKRQVFEAGFIVRGNGLGVVPSLTNVRQIAAGNSHGCAILGDGTVRCFGLDCWGSLDAAPGMCEGTSRVGEPIPGVTGALDVAAGDLHSCAVGGTGTVTCWGSAFNGATGGLGGLTEVANLDDVVEVAAGNADSCARKSDGTVWCWGSNADGAVGCGASCPPLPDDGPPWFLEPVQVPGIIGAVELDMGPGNTVCARLEGGTVQCWGRAAEGQVGVAGMMTAPSPVEVPDLTDTASISVGASHVCAGRADDGGFFCWGDGDARQLGDARTEHGAPDPVFSSERLHPVSVIAHPLEIAVPCWRLPDAQVRCLGSDVLGRSGQYPGIPQVSFSGRSAVSVSASAQFGCIVEPGGAVHCDGEEDSFEPGRLGTADADGHVMGLEPASQVVTGARMSCALLETGRVSCWGSNGDFQLGSEGETTATPEEVPGVDGVVELAAGDGHVCARDGSGKVTCWGRNSAGQAGVRPVPQPTLPRGVVLPAPAAQIDARNAATCAVVEGGEVWCWGALGRSPRPGVIIPAQPDPERVVGVDDADQVEVGSDHACARLRSGEVMCWGENFTGALGNGRTGPGSEVPVPVRELSDAVDLDCGGFHCCVTTEVGQSLCWGDNSMLRLGLPTAITLPDQVSTPTATGDLVNLLEGL